MVLWYTISPKRSWARMVRRRALTLPVYQARAEFFKLLSHPARIRVLELLHDRERSVGELLEEMDLEQSHLSKQLNDLRRANLVRTRKKGSSVFYSVANPQIYELLEVAKKIIASSLSESKALLAELQALDYVEASQPPGES